MKTTLAFLAAVLAGNSMVMADVPEPVLQQVRKDLRAVMKAANAEVSEEKMTLEMSAFEKAAADVNSDVAKNFDFTAEELKAFASGTAVPTDSEMAQAVLEITKVLGDASKFPHLLAYYEKQRAAGQLSAQQKILHQRVCRLVNDNIKRHLDAK
jgi:hypothetical protein